jgi:beta-glucanase (GH16 family)
MKKFIPTCLLLGALTTLQKNAEAQNWQLVWQDEFTNGISADWVFETGNEDGWGNQELQYYRRENATVEDGKLVITAKHESFGGYNYTSSRMKTLGKKSWKYGKIEARIKMPAFSGIWPAFWMLGSNHSEVGWPASGELDAMEVFGAQQSAVRQFIHLSSSDDPGRDLSFGEGVPGNRTELGHSLDSQTHLYGVYFDDSRVDFYVDRQKTLSLTAGDARSSGRAWPFGQPQFLVVNIAVGGLAGDPAATSFPRTMTVGDISIWSAGPPFAQVSR